MITAEEARKESNQWKFWDTWQLARYEKRIKKKIRKGEREVVSVITPRPNVVKKLREVGYDVTIGNPLGVVIKW